MKRIRLVSEDEQNSNVSDQSLDVLWEAIESAVEAKAAAISSSTATQSTTISLFSTPAVVSTVSVTTTILSTTFVTVPYSTTTTADSSSGLAATATGAGTVPSTSTDISSSHLFTSTTSSSSSTTIGMVTLLPPIVTPSMTSSNAVATSTNGPASNSTGMSSASNLESQSQKKAIVGGLSGAIGGLILIGVLICLILRVRRKRREPTEMQGTPDDSEKQRPMFMRNWPGLALVGQRSPARPSRQRPQSTATVSVDEEHRIIRMNTRHWPRPFALGAGEGYRDSVPHGRLRVVNPDLTPRRSSVETPSSFLRKQRSALTGFVFGAPRASLQQSRSRAPSDFPTIHVVDPSRDNIAPYARPASGRSYPSINTLSVVRQTPPEDPFVHDIQRPPSTARAPRSRAASAWSNVRLNPFRARSNTTNNPMVHTSHNASHFSFSTSAGDRRSDPFDLDGPSLRGSQPPQPSPRNRFL